MASLYHLARQKLSEHRDEAAKACVEGAQMPLDQVRYQQGVAEGLRIALADLEDANKDWDKA